MGLYTRSYSCRPRLRTQQRADRNGARHGRIDRSIEKNRAGAGACLPCSVLTLAIGRDVTLLAYAPVGVLAGSFEPIEHSVLLVQSVVPCSQPSPARPLAHLPPEWWRAPLLPSHTLAFISHTHHRRPKPNTMGLEPPLRQQQPPRQEADGSEGPAQRPSSSSRMEEVRGEESLRVWSRAGVCVCAYNACVRVLCFVLMEGRD